MSICLCMIVRDEQNIIERCLDSVRGLIDTWVIIDTGSTDATREIIGGYMLDADIPGKLHERPWVNFGVNRTELLELARGKADWLLLLDADHEVIFDHDKEGLARLPQLSADSYLVKHTGDPQYWVKRLVRGDRRWWYVGATHEYITCEEPDNEQRLDAITIHEHYDGGRRPEKFERDLRLLEEADHSDPRTMFYLAQTLRDLGRTEEAVNAYRWRARMDGWREETFYSLYEAGRLGNDIVTLFDAWSYSPHRAEPLYELAWRFRKRRAYQAAFLVAEQGLGMPVPGDRLFVHRWIYDWGIEFEYSIAAYWAGHPDWALAACDRLLENPELPASYVDQVRLNRQYCTNPRITN